MGSFSIWHWLIVLLVVVLLFGTKKLRNVGGDLGSAIKSFRKGLNEGDDESAKAEKLDLQGRPVEPSATRDNTRDRGN